MEDERIDYLPDFRLKILQKRNGFKFGTDAVALATWVMQFGTVGKKVLDVGAGSGIMPLMFAAGSQFQRIYGIEAQADIAEMSMRSVQGNGLEGRICLYHERVEHAVSRFGHGFFDVVVTNPPYFHAGSGLKNELSNKAMSRHESEDSLNQWLLNISRLLRSGGELYLVHRPERIADILCLMRKYRTEPKEMIYVQSGLTCSPSLVMIKGKRDAKPGMKIHPPLLNRNGVLRFSDEEDLPDRVLQDDRRGEIHENQVADTNQ